ncbi:MAG TPA: serine/threonine-protein kinase [Candidatus Eisenbacteria bacterium]|nr:serine/threonine-protein kinase [Candidatus Eisenbacteria bacterium]
MTRPEDTSQNTVMPRGLPLVAMRQDSGSDSVAPEVHADSVRRFGWLALIYSLTYLTVEIYAVSTHSEMPLDRHLLSLIPISIGLLVWGAARAGRITRTAFPKILIAFQLVSTFGIILATWGWETYAGQALRDLAGLAGGDPNQFLARLQEHKIQLFSPDGVPWIGVWILIVPLVLPLSPRQTAIGSLLSASILPAYFALSLLVHGASPEVSWWAWKFIADLSVPTYICAGIAFVGSRVMYGLERQLSDARQLGSYRLEERLGAGGMGEVWRAKHRLLARPAAIKLIRTEAVAVGGGDPAAARTALTRFEREAQATSMLGSPHTIEIYDFGVTENGSFYYVMELLDGMDFRRLVERHGVIPPNRAVYLLTQVCHSLADAHASGLIHRDIKPANIFTCRRGRDDDFVKVLDFGLVKETAQRKDAQLTAEGTTTGTPAFMAPEAVYGADRVDARSDLYALGCIAYWLLTGKLVFEADTPIRMLLGHLNDPPPRPSTRTSQAIPPGLEQVIMECLEKDPSKRPGTAEALARRLDESLDGPRWTAADARAWWQQVREDAGRSGAGASTGGASTGGAVRDVEQPPSRDPSRPEEITRP